ncbi:MAG: excisionase family DNA-binding protein [Actinomycetota bacterium]
MDRTGRVRARAANSRDHTAGGPRCGAARRAFSSIFRRHVMAARQQATRARGMVSLAEAAELAGLSIRTLRRRIADGELPAYRTGPRLIRVHLDEPGHAGGADELRRGRATRGRIRSAPPQPNGTRTAVVWKALHLGSALTAMDMAGLASTEVSASHPRLVSTRAVCHPDGFPPGPRQSVRGRAAGSYGSLMGTWIHGVGLGCVPLGAYPCRSPHELLRANSTPVG